MPIKSTEEELARKRAYYVANKDKILEKKHSRGRENYDKKRERELGGSSDEWEKNQIRKLAKQETYAAKPESCEMCSVKESDLGYPLERHEMSYDISKPIDVVYVCKTCHSELDRYRRREE